MLKEIKIKYYFEEEDKEIVKKWLKDNNKTLQDLAKTLHFNYNHFQHVWNGRRSLPEEAYNELIGLGIKLN